MIAQAKKKTRWWVIILFTPLLLSCSLGPILWDLTIQIGQALIYEASGEYLEGVLDNLFRKLLGIENCDVIPLRNNPLEGVYPCEMELMNLTNRRSLRISNVKFYRENENSKWEVIPAMKEMIESKIQ